MLWFSRVWWGFYLPCLGANTILSEIFLSGHSSGTEIMMPTPSPSSSSGWFEEVSLSQEQVNTFLRWPTFASTFVGFFAWICLTNIFFDVFCYEWINDRFTLKQRVARERDDKHKNEMLKNGNINAPRSSESVSRKWCFIEMFFSSWVDT